MALDALTWSCIDRVLAKCEGVRVPSDFCVTAAVVLRQVYPYDSGVVYFLGEDGRLRDVRLLGGSRAFLREYLEHYMDADDGAYSIERAVRNRALYGPSRLGDSHRVVVVDWEREPHDTRFWREFASRLRTRWSTCLCLHDLEDRVRVVIDFDRGERAGAPTSAELEALSVCGRHIGALYRNFYVEPPTDPCATMGDLVAGRDDGRPDGDATPRGDGAAAGGTARLTPRERAVGHELVQGHSPKQAAQVLGVSRATVYKHMEHMHRKLGVNNQVALIRRLNQIFSQDGG